MKNPGVAWRVFAACGLGVGLASAAWAGTATNFTLPNHKTGAPVSLHDLAGSVLLLEFFSATCPACQTATPQIEAGIHDYYETNCGNADGLPVTVVYINETQPPTNADSFIQLHGLDLVFDDDDQRTVLGQFGGRSYPHFVVINGVTNATTHSAWQIVHTASGFSGATLGNLRNEINKVRGTLRPRVVNWKMLGAGTFKAAFQAQKGRTNVIEGTADWETWTALTNIVSSHTVRFFDALEPGAGRRFYRVRVLP